MLNEQQREYLGRAVVPMQVIVGALAMGVLVFLAIAVVIGDAVAGQRTMVAYVAAVFAVLAFVAWVFAPMVIASVFRRAVAEGHDPASTGPYSPHPDVGLVGPLAAAFQTRLIVANAFLEGAAFFNLVAYLVKGQNLNLGIAIALLLCIVTQIATRARLEGWVSHELEVIQQMRP